MELRKSINSNKKIEHKCLVCGGGDSALVLKNMPGFEVGTFFEIFKCNHCKSHFIDENKIDYSIYDKIYYYADKTVTYKRYQKYFNEIKNVEDKLQYLCDHEDIPLVIKDYVEKISNKKNDISILEIGCGLGYTTYALNEAGYKCYGLDISRNSIEKAKNMFGDYYIQGDANKLGEYTEYKGKYDVVFAQEVIEHISNVSVFIDNIMKFLKPGGALILTTPNKDYMPKKCLWFTDTPPVHTLMVGSYFFKQYAKNKNINIYIYNYNLNIKNRNMLLEIFYSQMKMLLANKRYFTPIGVDFNNIDVVDTENLKNIGDNSFKHKIGLFLNNKYCCFLSHIFIKLFLFWFPSSTLGVVLKKNN